MPIVKIKVPTCKPRISSKASQLEDTPASASAPTSRKRRRRASDHVEGEVEGERDARSRIESPDTGHLIEDVDDADASGNNLDFESLDEDDLGLRRPYSKPYTGSGRPVKEPTRRTSKRASVLHSDEDYNDEEQALDQGGDVDTQKHERDVDDDFIIESPPQKGYRKISGRGRGRGAKADRSKDVGVTMKDERKTGPGAHAITSTGTAMADTEGTTAVPGTKRRRETVSEQHPKGDIEVDGNVSQAKTEAQPPSQPQPQQEDHPPPSKIRKFPTIKKFKSGTSTVAPGAGDSPDASSTAAKSAGTKPPRAAAGSGTFATNAASLPPAGSVQSTTSEVLPIHVTLSRKPVAPVPQTQDLDLSRPDIYNSLFFKGGSSSAPKAGINPRIREEERRKELMKMRDEARATRMAELQHIMAKQKNRFDLLGGQDKVACFEAKLRQRNSPALYPNRLGSAIKFLVEERNKKLAHAR